MGIIKTQYPVKYFCAVTISDTVDPRQVLEQLKERVAAQDTKSEIYNFDSFTDYYQEQMGINLKKFFISFKDLMEMERLPEFKMTANALEAEFAVAGKRQANLDPGYLTQAKLVLATTKDYSHRLYLGNGIFGDLHLIYRKRSYQAQAWTYPDYRQEIVLNYFNRLREIYREQLADLLENNRKNI